MRTGIVVSLLVLASTTLAAEPLRTVYDATRNRTWSLQPDGVYLEGKRVELPGWLHVGDPYACAPDLAVDAQGGVVVSSNIAPILWRVDPLTARVSKHELVLDADTDKDVGFSGLTYAPDQGVFFAVSAVYGSLWRIDPLLRRAQKIALSTPILNACGLALERVKSRRGVVLCARGELGMWRVQLTPDQRSAYARRDACFESKESL